MGYFVSSSVIISICNSSLRYVLSNAQRIGFISKLTQFRSLFHGEQLSYTTCIHFISRMENKSKKKSIQLNKRKPKPKLVCLYTYFVIQVVEFEEEQERLLMMIGERTQNPRKFQILRLNLNSPT